MKITGSRRIFTLLIVVLITSQCCCCIVTPVSQGAISFDLTPSLSVQELPALVMAAFQHFVVQFDPLLLVSG